MKDVISDKLLTCPKLNKPILGYRKCMRIEHAQKDIRIIGFDSAWADKSLGAICALEYDKSGRLSLQQPRLVNFEKGSEFILKPKARYSCTLVAMDQPTIVQNKTGMRPVERVVASLMGFTGGGVQPANTSKTCLFGPTFNLQVQRSVRQ